MSWDQEPPKAEELKSAAPPPQAAQSGGWDQEPPTEIEVQRLSEQDPSMGDQIMSGVVKAGEFVDSYTGAPTRAAISAAQKGENPFSAAWNQVGEDPSTAPTGKQIAKDAGLSDQGELFNIKGKRITDTISAASPLMGSILKPISQATGFDEVEINPSPAGAAGFAIDVGADPLNLVPGAGYAKGVKAGTKAVTGTAKVAAETAGAAANMAGRGARVIPGVAKTADTVKSAAEIMSESAKSTSRALSNMFKPTQADDFKSLVSIAEKNGIPKELLPEAVEFGHNSVITRASRNRAEGLLGEEHLNRFNEGLDAVRDATEKKIYAIGGGSAPDRIEAGQIIRQGYDKGVDNFFSNIDVTHNKMMEAMPGLQVAPESLAKIDSKLAGMEKWAKGQAKRGFTAADRSQAEQVLLAIEAVREGNGSYKQTVETLRRIGDTAYKSKNILADIPPDIEKFRDLYNTVNEALIDTVGKAAGAPVAEELRATNKLISEFLGEKSTIAGAIGNKQLSPEKLFATLVENGDTKKIAALKKILPPEDFKKLKGAFLASQVRKNADEQFTFKGLHNSLRNKKDLLGSVLDPNEIEEMGELIRLGDRFGTPVLSTSGTGASSLFGDLYKGVRSGMESDALIGTLKNKARARSLPDAPPGKPLLPGASAEKAQSSSIIPMRPPSRGGAQQNYERLLQVSPMAARTLYVKDKNDKQAASNRPAIKGPDKWSVDGFAKLSDHDPDGAMKNPGFVERVFSSAKAKSLLVQASDLKPGSKAMDDVYSKIKKQLGEK